MGADRQGRGPKLTGAFFDTGYQIGCGVDIANDVLAQAGFAKGVAPHVDVVIAGGPRANVELTESAGTGCQSEG